MQPTIVTQQETYFRIDNDTNIVVGFGPKNCLYYGSYTVIAFGVKDGRSVAVKTVHFNGVRLAYNSKLVVILDKLKPDDKPILFDAANADAHSPAFQVCTVTGLSHPLHRIHKTHSAHKIHKTHKTHETQKITNQSHTTENATVACHCCRVVVYLPPRGPPQIHVLK